MAVVGGLAAEVRAENQIPFCFCLCFRGPHGYRPGAAFTTCLNQDTLSCRLSKDSIESLSL